MCMLLLVRSAVRILRLSPLCVSALLLLVSVSVSVSASPPLRAQAVSRDPTLNRTSPHLHMGLTGTDDATSISSSVEVPTPLLGSRLAEDSDSTVVLPASNGVNGIAGPWRCRDLSADQCGHAEDCEPSPCNCALCWPTGGGTPTCVRWDACRNATGDGDTCDGAVELKEDRSCEEIGKAGLYNLVAYGGVLFTIDFAWLGCLLFAAVACVGSRCSPFLAWLHSAFWHDGDDDRLLLKCFMWQALMGCSVGFPLLASLCRDARPPEDMGGRSCEQLVSAIVWMLTLAALLTPLLLRLLLLQASLHPVWARGGCGRRMCALLVVVVPQAAALAHLIRIGTGVVADGVASVEAIMLLLLGAHVAVVALQQLRKPMHCRSSDLAVLLPLPICLAAGTTTMLATFALDALTGTGALLLSSAELLFGFLTIAHMLGRCALIESACRKAAAVLLLLALCATAFGIWAASNFADSTGWHHWGRLGLSLTLLPALLIEMTLSWHEWREAPELTFEDEHEQFHALDSEPELRMQGLQLATKPSHAHAYELHVQDA